MYDVLAVAVSDASGNAAQQVASLGLWQDATGVDVVEEVTVFGHLEHEVDLSRGLHDVMDCEDVRMVEPLNSVHLSR